MSARRRMTSMDGVIGGTVYLISFFGICMELIEIGVILLNSSIELFILASGIVASIAVYVLYTLGYLSFTAIEGIFSVFTIKGDNVNLNDIQQQRTREQKTKQQTYNNDFMDIMNLRKLYPCADEKYFCQYADGLMQNSPNLDSIKAALINSHYQYLNS
ncbi:MAG: hypothetical protein SR2Q5_06560 [Quinella sp. 2Q5]|nr:hypothetical protein [Quinella sp. 2Q5]